MIFHKFKIAAIPIITDSYCECGNDLKQVSNGLIGAALYCMKCERVYVIKRIQVPKKGVTKEFIKQCREECGKKGLK